MNQGNYTIREIHKEDAESFLKVREQIETESTGMIYEKGERNTTIEQLEKSMENIKKSSATGTFVIEENKKTCGFIIIHGMSAKRVNKTRELVLGVLKEHWGKGMGGKLLDYAIEFSKENNTHKLELGVWADNKIAISLYKKKGFVEEGVKKDHAFINNTFVDLICMGLILD